MTEDNPWKTPFGRLLIGSSIVAAVAGFPLAAGVTTYFNDISTADARGDVAAVDAEEASHWGVAEAPAQRDITTDPEAYAEALAGLDSASQVEEPQAQVPAPSDIEAGDEPSSGEELAAGYDEEPGIASADVPE